MQSEFGKLPSTPQFPFWNNLPTPVKSLVRPMLFASVGLHALLIFVPLPGEKQESKPAPEKTVKVTQLPPTSKSNSTAKPLAKVAVTPAPRPVIPAARPNALTIPSTVRPSSVAQPAPAAAPNPAPATPPATNNPFNDFPRYPNATVGSFESLPATLSPLSFQTSDPLADVEKFFRSELPKKQFEIGTPIDLGDVKAIPVTKGSITKYLHLFTRSKGTVYLLLDTPIPINSLPKGTKFQEELPERGELNKLLTEDLVVKVNFVNNNPDTELSEPTSFASVAVDLDIGKATKVPEGTTIPIAELDTLLQSQLASIGFTLTPSGDYGGGKVYQITKNSYTSYLTIAPTQDGGGWVYVFEKAPGT
ncbi:MAG: hypothetical protein LH660_18055 [Phormidesmis sp. CAN_BIN36]|nr:hypothetical protein [Phormidesmis sp. CAN_BIN36]